MPKPDNELINQFREKFGDLLLTCDGRGTGGAAGDALPPKLPISHNEGVDLLDVMQLDSSGLALGLASGSLVSGGFNTLGPLSPTVISRKHQIHLDRTLPGSGAVFHNEAGDLHSPMVQWDTTTAPLHDTSTQNGPMNPWAGSGYFAPLSPTQHWLPEDTPNSTQSSYKLDCLTHRDSGYATLDSLDRMLSTNETSHESNSEFLSPESEATFTSPRCNEEKFHYNVTLEAPTAMISHTKGRPMTYLNKGHTYTLRVQDSKPPVIRSGLLKYRTFVGVSFEEQDQRSNPVASWQLWKESRGLKEAEGHQSELVAVEYVDLLQDSARCRNHLQTRLEKSRVDGFCATWTADPTTQSYEGVISLRFHFLSTDFSRSKGVKGVPVRLCVKTTTVPEFGKGTIEHDTEVCYCVVKLFRDHGAERKLANDKELIKKKIGRLNKEIVEELQSASFVGPRHASTPKDPSHLRSRHRRRKSSIKQRASQKITDLRLKLAEMNKLLTSARQVTVLNLRGTEHDDPDFHPVILPRTKRSSDLTVLSYKAVACFYVRVNECEKVLQDKYAAIYLVERTSLDLQEKLAEKAQADPKLIAHIIWETRSGLKILVDDDVVKHIPEGQIMTAEFCEVFDKDALSDKSSAVVVKLLF